MNALENAKKLSKEQVMNRINALMISEYGLCKGFLFERLKAAAEESREEQKELGVICALNNADTDGVLLEILKENPEKIMEGISIAAYALGCEKKVLMIPEYADGLADCVKETAGSYQIEVLEGLVDIRADKGCALMHIVTAAKLSDSFAGCAEKGIYVSINGAAVKKVPCNTKIFELADCLNAKAIIMGYEYHKPEDGRLTVEEAAIDNGVLRVLTEKDCIVSETEKKLLQSRKQSCGKCVFCREGLIQLQYMQKEIKNGKGKQEFLDITKEIGEAMTFSAMCTMGQTSSKIALTAAEAFQSEYEAHIKKKNCPAGICFSSEAIYIDPKLCTGCGECMDICPKDCIEGKANYIHMIDEFDCDRCGKCMEACEESAIMKTGGKVPKLPNRLTKVGRFRKR